jgi:uncharacterized protein YjeT (DUF2065 family)
MKKDMFYSSIAGTIPDWYRNQVLAERIDLPDMILRIIGMGLKTKKYGIQYWLIMK